VVEIGPGRGALTARLMESGARMILVEIDESLAAGLRERFSEHPQVTVATADARAFSIDSVPGIGKVPYKLVGNLPYYAASPIVRHFLETDRPPDLMVVMVQREVARGMTAPPGEMSLLSIGVQFYAEARSVIQVPPRAFSPPPNVHSAVVRMARRTRPPIDVDSPAAFFSLARAGFAAPRKTLANSLALGLRLDNATVSEFLTQSQLDPARRPATLSLEEWGSLYQAWKESGRPGLEQVRKAPAIHDGRR